MSDDEGEWDLESHWLARLLVRLFGKARVIRFAEWMDAKYDPQGKDRCAYLVPLTHEQCTLQGRASGLLPHGHPVRR